MEALNSLKMNSVIKNRVWVRVPPRLPIFNFIFLTLISNSMPQSNLPAGFKPFKATQNSSYSGHQWDEVSVIVENGEQNSWVLAGNLTWNNSVRFPIIGYKIERKYGEPTRVPNIREKAVKIKAPTRKKKCNDLDAYLFLNRAIEDRIENNNKDAQIAILHFPPTDASNKAQKTILDRRDERNQDMHECAGILSKAFAALAREKYPDNKEMLKFWHANKEDKVGVDSAELKK